MIYGPEVPPGQLGSSECLPSKEAGRFLGHSGPILAVRLTRDGDYFLSCGKDRTIRLWNPIRQNCITTFSGHGYEVRDASIEAENGKFVSCGRDKQIFLWDVSARRVVRKFRGHESEVNSVSYSENCNIVVSGGYDQTVRVWDCRSRSVESIQTIKACQDSVMSVSCLGTTDILAGSVDGTLRRFDVRTGHLITDLLHHPITSVGSTKDFKCVLACCTDSCIRVLSREGGNLLGTYRGHLHSYSRIEATFTPSDAHIVGCSEDGKIYYWDVLSSQIETCFQAHDAEVTSLSIHPKGDFLLTSSTEGCTISPHKQGINGWRAKTLRDQRQSTVPRMHGKTLAAGLLLILAATFLLPRSLVGPFKSGRDGNSSMVGAKAAEGAHELAEYAIVIDAGSTGSRVHVFKFTRNKKEDLDLHFDEFDQLKPGLSSYAQDPKAAAKSLEPLLSKALEVVPKPLHASTPIMVGATAGLRLLPDGKADLILEEVRRYLSTYPFQFFKEDVKILSGIDEGAFAWLTLNYLLGNLGLEYFDTVAAIDLGGGSVQQAFAMSPDEIKTAPKSDYITKLKGGGKEYSVYVHSYLGYGLMAARAAVLEIDPNGPEDDSHPCIHEGFKGKYKYGDNEFVAEGHDQGAQHDQCMATVLTALRKDEDCGAPQPQCSFTGAWSGPRIPERFYVSSYFWDRAADAGLLNDETATEITVAPKHFKDHAQEACELDVEDVRKTYPRIQDDNSPYFCLDLTYAHTLLTRGFKIPEEKEVTLVKKVKYKGDNVEASWPLGAGIDMLS